MSHAEIDGGTITGASGSFTTLGNSGTTAFGGAAATSASSTVATLTLTTVLSSGFGFQTSAGAVATLAAIASIITCLKDKGLMAS